MSMSISIPTDLEPFVRQELASGSVQSEEELVTKALELYRELKSRHDDLRWQVQRSLDQAERGQVAPWDMGAMKKRLAGEFDQSGPSQP